MNVTKWNPFGELEEIADRYGGFFGTRLPMRERFDLLGKDIEWKPTADIIERDDEYLIKAELPGVERDDIDASAIKAQSKDGVLQLQLPKTEAKKPEAVKIAIR